MYTSVVILNLLPRVAPKRFRHHYAKIAGTTVKVSIEEPLKAVNKLFIATYVSRPSSTTLHLVVQQASQNDIRTSANKRTLTIEGPGLGNILDPFTFIGLYQALLRFVGIHSPKHGYILLHGSVAVWKGGGIIFADDGDSVGKTLSSIELALKSKQYVGDEFCFYNLSDQTVTGYKFIPLHLRPVVLRHLKKHHNFSPPRRAVQDSKAGAFVYAEDIFLTKSRVRVDKFVFVHYSKRCLSARRLSENKAIAGLAMTVAAHPIKLTDPLYDRMSFARRSDGIKSKRITGPAATKYVQLLGALKDIIQIEKQVECFQLDLKTPCQIVSALEIL